MPYTIRKVKNKLCYRLTNKINKHVFSKCGPLEKIKKQIKLLNAIKYNKKFKPYSKNKTHKKRIVSRNFSGCKSSPDK